MARHRVYAAIIAAVRDGRLQEPFGRAEFVAACPTFGEGTYKAFLDKHRIQNPGNQSELFERVGAGRFRCIRPFRYGL